MNLFRLVYVLVLIIICYICTCVYTGLSFGCVVVTRINQCCGVTIAFGSFGFVHSDASIPDASNNVDDKLVLKISCLPFTTADFNR